MAALRYISRNIFLNKFKTERRLPINNSCLVCMRLLNYTALEYDDKQDPAPLFFSKDVQSLLKILTRVDLTKVYRKRKLGDKQLQDPEYKFMTDEQLEEAVREAREKAEEILQIPPVVAVRKPINKIISRDPALQGLETSKLVFTDITFGVKDSDRLIVVREPDGTLREAEWELKSRINQVYFPKKNKNIEPPKMFQDQYLESLLNRREYEFILDNACAQFEPNDQEYQRVVSITYQHLSDNNSFDLLRSTRHFGSLTFFLVWNKNIDNLLLDLIETSNIEEADKLLQLYSKIHNLQFEGSGSLGRLEDFIKKCSFKKGALELAVQAYKDILQQREKLEQGIKAAHGLS